MNKHPLNTLVLLIAFGVIALLTILSFWGAAAYDEGATSNSFVAIPFELFRFPTHTLLWDFFSHNAARFYSGLLINAIIYSILFERIYSFTKKRHTNG